MKRITKLWIIATFFILLFSVPSEGKQQYQTIHYYPTIEPVKVGSLYYWSEETPSNATFRMHCGKNAGRGGVELWEDSYMPMSYNGRMYFLTDGSIVYYVCADSNGKHSINSIQTDGREKQTYKQFSGNIPVLMQQLGTKITYLLMNDSGYYDLYSLDLKTKKTKRVWRKITELSASASHQYCFTLNVTNKKAEIKIFDVSKGKVIKTRSVKKKQGDTARAIGATGKYYYFCIDTEDENGTIVSKVYRMPLSGKRKPSLAAELALGYAGRVDAADDKFIFYQYYDNGDKYFKYNISTGKSVKTTNKKSINAQRFLFHVG